MTKSRSQAGYTITELLVVLVILGLIAAAISPQIIGRLDSSKTKAARLQLDVVISALDAFHVDVGRYPTEEEGVEALLIQPDGTSGWAGPYLRSRRNLTDPWGALLRYAIDDKGQAAVSTLGADGREGGAEADTDLRAPDI
jgi:general secretion pathway protein G